MPKEQIKQYKADPTAEYLTQGAYEFSVDNIVLMLKKIAILKEMGKPENDEQEIAFAIIADCILAEETGGKELRVKTLGVEVGRLERNMQFWTRHVPKNEKWEPKIITELQLEIERARASGLIGVYDEARTNVLYGTWRKTDMLGFYIYEINNYPWKQVNPILHSWYERFIIHDAFDVTPKNPQSSAKK